MLHEFENLKIIKEEDLGSLIDHESNAFPF